MAPSSDDPNGRRPNLVWLLVVQGLSLFNDNFFKQVVLLSLVVVPTAGSGTVDAQGWALAAFAAPFLLLSGVAGFVADRFEKQTLLRFAKSAEVAIMAWGAFALFSGDAVRPMMLIAALFALAAHTAFLVPIKYGALPVIVPQGELARANAWMQILAYVAIVLGMGTAGALMTLSDGRPLWIGGCAVFVAIAGVVAAWRIGPLGAANRALRFDYRGFFVPRHTWRSVRGDRMLRDALVVYATFWWFSGTAQPTINAVGRLQLGISEFQTSVLLATSALGVVIGCAIAGRQRQNTAPNRLLWWSAVVMTAIQALAGWPQIGLIETGGVAAFAAVLFVLGICSGVFLVPLHVQVQIHATDEEKGQVMALQNWLNWVAVLLAGAAYPVLRSVVERLDWAPSSVFFVLAVLSAVCLLAFRPTEHSLLRLPMLARSEPSPAQAVIAANRRATSEDRPANGHH